VFDVGTDDSERAKTVELSHASHCVAKDYSVLVESLKHSSQEGDQGIFEFVFSCLKLLDQLS